MSFLWIGAMAVGYLHCLCGVKKEAKLNDICLGRAAEWISQQINLRVAYVFVSFGLYQIEISN